jgi:polysaccharide biosynthesis protein PslG
MKKSPFCCGTMLALALIALAMPMFPQALQTATPIPANFIDMITHYWTYWPTVPFYGLRLMPANTNWNQINTSPGVYDWSEVDGWLSNAQAHNVELVFVLAATPTWASSAPNDTTCAWGPGSCDPPNDLALDGSGTDQHWRTFVAAVATHVGKQINDWEVWNEPLNLEFWKGSYAQLARMAEDARQVILSINPTAKLISGGSGAISASAMQWWDGYAAAGGLKWADIIGLHGDVRKLPATCGVYPQPEHFLIVMKNLRSVLIKYGENNKPIWETEASWGRTDTDCFTNQNLQAAFLARFYVLHWSEGVARFYWRAWIDSAGGLFTVAGGINPAGIAYGQVYDWLVGATMTEPCWAQGSIWTCPLTRPNGYVGKLVWDTADSCSGSSCSITMYAVTSEYLSYRTLAGTRVLISGGQVPIGAEPILLENQR